MPTYEYKCKRCNNITTLYNQKFNSPDYKKMLCEHCENTTIHKRIISKNTFAFHCEGFYNSSFPNFDRPNKFKKKAYKAIQEGAFDKE